jgi:hypothetical protein
MYSIKTLALTALAAAMAALSACGASDKSATPAAPAAAPSPQDPNNPLIGAWRFIGFGKGPTTDSSACALTMTFTSTQWTQTRAGGDTTDPVTYIPSPKTVYVVDGQGGHTTYIRIDPNHIALESFAPCTYERTA